LKKASNFLTLFIKIDNINVQPWLLVLLPLIGGLLGYFINNFLVKKRENELLINKEKRLHYQLFIDLFIDILSQSKLEKQLDQNELMKQFYEFQKKHLLYSSPNVINSFSTFWVSIQNEENKAKPLNLLTGMTKFILTMRADLGLNNKNLGKKGEKLLKGMLTDYDKHFK